MSITEIEAAIEQLPPAEVAQLKEWLRQHENKNQSTQAPLLQLLGTIDTAIPDVGLQHDEYLAQNLLLEAPTRC